MSLFVVKITYSPNEELGKEKTENYLVKATSFGEAESKTLAFVELYGTCFNVKSVTRSKCVGLLESERSGKFFEFTITFEKSNENTGRTTKVSMSAYVRAEIFKEAKAKYEKEIRGSIMEDFRISLVKKTPIVDYIEWATGREIRFLTKKIRYGKEKPHYVCGMSVPPVMMANIATEIYSQWLSKIK